MRFIYVLLRDLLAGGRDKSHGAGAEHERHALSFHRNCNWVGTFMVPMLGIGKLNGRLVIQKTVAESNQHPKICARLRV
jgi:hypothetical protein